MSAIVSMNLDTLIYTYNQIN